MTSVSKILTTCLTPLCRMAPGVEARPIGSVVAPCAFKGWLARVGPPLGVLGRGCYFVFNARLVRYRYPTSKWMCYCRSQLIAGEWKQGQSVPWLPIALSRSGFHAQALLMGCQLMGASRLLMQNSRDIRIHNFETCLSAWCRMAVRAEARSIGAVVAPCAPIGRLARPGPLHGVPMDGC